VRFPYRRYHVQETSARPQLVTIYRPVIPVRVLGPRGDAFIFGLLDSGADTTVLPGFLVDRIGVDLEPQTGRFRGVGGQVVTVSFGTVDLELHQGNESYRWPARVGFLDVRTVAVLGRAALLEYFDVTFLGADNAVTLERNTSPLPQLR